MAGTRVALAILSLASSAVVPGSLGPPGAAPSHVPDPSHGPRYERIVVGRMFRLPIGHQGRSFDFRIRGDYADAVVLRVSHGARVAVRALSAGRMQGIGGSTRQWSSGCRHLRSVDVCSQGEEWCGLVNGRWHALLVKWSTAPAVVRVALVFVRRVPALRPDL